MSSLPLVELYIVPSRGLRAALVTSVTNLNPAPRLALTNGDASTLRLRFLAESDNGTASALDYGAPATIGFAARAPGATTPVIVATAFARATDQSGGVWYDAPLPLNTAEAAAALGASESVELVCDIEVTVGSARTTLARLDATLYRQVYTDGPAPDVLPLYPPAAALADVLAEIDSGIIINSQGGPAGPGTPTGIAYMHAWRINYRAGDILYLNAVDAFAPGANGPRVLVDGTRTQVFAESELVSLPPLSLGVHTIAVYRMGSYRALFIDGIKTALPAGEDVWASDVISMVGTGHIIAHWRASPVNWDSSQDLFTDAELADLTTAGAWAYTRRYTHVYDGRQVSTTAWLDTQGGADLTMDPAYARPVRPTAAVGTPPDATTTVAGKVELATLAETLAGMDGARAVVPVNLATYVQNKALTLTGEQTITGRKTFAGGLAVTNGGADLSNTHISLPAGGILNTTGGSVIRAHQDLHLGGYLGVSGNNLSLGAGEATARGTWYFDGDIRATGPGQSRLETAFNYLGVSGAVNYIAGATAFGGSADFTGCSVTGIGVIFNPNETFVRIGDDTNLTFVVQVGNELSTTDINGAAVRFNYAGTGGSSVFHGPAYFQSSVSLPNQGAAPTDIAGVVAILRAVNLCT